MRLVIRRKIISTPCYCNFEKINGTHVSRYNEIKFKEAFRKHTCFIIGEGAEGLGTIAFALAAGSEANPWAGT